MPLSCIPLPPVPVPLLCLLLTSRCCATLSDSDLWSGSIWDQAQKARDKHALNSDRLMQHIWQQPDRAHKFVDCDILADSQTDKHFQFLNLYDADDARENLLNGLPGDGYVRGMWPLEDGKSTVPYKLSGEVDSKLADSFRKAAGRWEVSASVQFIESSRKPHLEVELDGGCFATLGYHPTEPRKLSLHPGRCTVAVIIHLLGHVLGLPHPTSTVGRTNELYLMPHHAAPRSMGVLRTRAGVAFDPLDIMAVDPWFCGVSNRSTWRPLSPSQYRWAAVAGHWDLAGHQYPEARSASTGLLQREIQMKAGAAGCWKKCKDPCQEFMTPRCNCLRPFSTTDSAYMKLAADQGLWKHDMGSGGALNLKLLVAPRFRIFFHSTNVGDRIVADDTGRMKCWQCSLLIFTLRTNGVLDSKQNQLIALGSRCTLFSMEVNGAVEESWYRLCLHDLLHTNEGKVDIAFRGPGSIMIRYFGSEDVFPEFHSQMWRKVALMWSFKRMINCKCSDGPGVEIQSSVNKQ